MRRGADLVDHRVRRLARKCAAELRQAGGRHAIELGHHVALAHAGRCLLEGRLLRRGRDLAGLMHVCELARRLLHAAPVDQQERIDESRVRQSGLEQRIPFGGVVVVVRLDADGPLVPTAAHDLLGDELHRMPLARSHVVVGIGDDVLGLEEGGEFGADRVHLAADPDRLLGVEADGHHLRRVERPAVIAGQPELVGRRGDQQQIDAAPGHFVFRAADAFEIFGTFKQKLHNPSPESSRGIMRRRCHNV